MGKPFFSVVIPTKNRSFLVGLAVQSVLRQSFEDFEIVIADNDDSDATRPVIEAFHDPRIRYYRTGSLSMPDNWDFAASQARGKYIAMMEDRQVLKKHALERVFKAVERTHHPVVSWLADVFLDTQQPPKIMLAGGSGNEELIPSQRILEYFIRQGWGGEFKRFSPRGLNSCIHHALADQIRSGPAGRLCLPQAPDYTLGFLQLAYCDSILHIDEALVVVGGFQYSTGRTARVNRREALQYFQGSDVDEARFYEHVPVKAVSTSGSLYNDYENVRALVGGNLADFPLELHTYFLQCFNDIQYSRKMGADVSTEMAAWERALSEQESALQGSAYRALFSDVIETNVSLSSELEAVRTSRDKWKKTAKAVEQKHNLLGKGYNYIKRSSIAYWALAIIDSPRIKFEISPEIESSLREAEASIPHDVPPEIESSPMSTDSPVPYPNALEDIMHEETKAACLVVDGE